MARDMSMTIEECFKGLSDRSRLRILNLLFRGELCGCDIQYVLAVSQSNVSRHLTYLKRAGLVSDRRKGYRIYFRLSDHAHAGSPMLLAYLRHEFAREPTFMADLRKLKAAIRSGDCSVSEAIPCAPAPRASVGRRRVTG